jgi:hypothetical protein
MDTSKEIQSLKNTVHNKALYFIRDLAISTLMLGLLIAFTKLVKFVVLLMQELGSLTQSFLNEKDTIKRGSKFIVYTPNGRRWEESFELNNTAEQLSSQINSNELTIFILILFSLIAFVALYFALDYLIDCTNKFKPYSIILLLLSFVSSVFYLEITDLHETGNGVCFLFTTTISIITGIVLIGYTLIFPNYYSPDK